jgi:hypothetical protein
VKNVHGVAVRTPAQDAVVEFLAGRSLRLIDVARAVAPHGSLRYGYATVHRAARNGRVRIVPGPRRGTFMVEPA